MKGKLVLFAIVCSLSVPVFGQGFSLMDCVEYASKSNANIVNASRDIDIANRKVKETIGSMLPQVDVSASYTNNLIQSTTLLPGALAGDTTGRMIPVQFGTQHNANGSLQITQKLFDPTFGIGLKAAKVSKGQADQSLKSTMEQVTYSIGVTYYQSLVVGKQLSTLRSTLATSAQQLQLAELKLKNGMAKQLDVDKLRVSYNNLKSQLQQNELTYSQTLNNLKYYMGMPVENKIVLTDTALILNEPLLSGLLGTFNIENRTDYQLQKITLDGYTLEKDRNQALYLPTLNVSLNYGLMAMRKEFNFLDQNQSWFNSASLVFSLRVPIFDGLQKHQRIEQAKISVEKAKTKLEQTEQSIKVDLSNYENQYTTAVSNINTEKENLALAENVYKNTQLAFNQGLSTSLDLVQSESSWNESMNNYYSKLLNLYIARINLEQSKGNLMNYLNKK